MKPVPPKARELIIAGTMTAATALCWVVAPDAKLVALGFIAIGIGFLGQAFYLWRKPSN